MIDYTTIKEAIRSQIEDVAEGPDVVWKDEPQQALSDQTLARVYLSITTSRGVGRDDYGHEWADVPGSDPPRQVYQEYVRGQRVLTVNVSCDVLHQAPDDAAEAVLDRIRTRLRRSESREAFLAANIALARRVEIGAIPTVRDQRAASSAAMDLFFNAAFFEVLKRDADYFERVAISSDLKNVDGTSFPSKLQIDETIPEETTP